MKGWTPDYKEKPKSLKYTWPISTAKSVQKLLKMKVTQHVCSIQTIAVVNANRTKCIMQQSQSLRPLYSQNISCIWQCLPKYLDSKFTRSPGHTSKIISQVFPQLRVFRIGSFSLKCTGSPIAQSSSYNCGCVFYWLFENGLHITRCAGRGSHMTTAVKRNDLFDMSRA